MSSCDNIGLVSYISVQVYEHVHRTQFRAILRRMSLLQTFTFAHLSSDEFFCLVPGDHRLSADGRRLELDESALAFFEQFERLDVVANAREAVKSLKKARRGGKKKQSHSTALADGSGSEGEAG